MRRFEVLDRHTKVFGRYFLEASAGTGKTFAIEHLATRAILDKDAALSIDKILIVTFTRAATRELKVRLRANLCKTLLFLQRGCGGPDYLQPVFEGGSGSVFSAQRRIEEALCLFDKASIFTLHGFCHKMLTEHAFEAGTFFEIPSPDTPIHSEKIYRVVEDFFRAGISLKEYSPSQIEKVVKGTSRGIEGLCSKIIAHIEKEPSIDPGITFCMALEQIKKALVSIRSGSFFKRELFMQDIEKILPLYKRVQKDHYIQADLLALYLEAGEISYDAFDDILTEKEYFLSLIQEENLKKGKDPSKLILHYPHVLSSLKKNLYPLIERAKDPQEIFLRLTYDCLKSWQSSIFFEESFTPDDLLKKMLISIEKEELKKKISDKYHMAIIDEFQDTDPIQWAIFKKLFLSLPSKSMYLVGDPKQSIYAFRSADVYTYLEAMNALGEESRLFLDTNYRSEPRLVHSLNTLFNHNLSKQWMQLPNLSKALEVRPVIAGHTNCDEEDKDPPLHFFIAEKGMGRGKKWPSEDIEQSQLFPFIAKEICRLRRERGYRLRQFAILVRDRYQASRLEEYLKKKEIACSVKKPLSLSSSLAYIALYDVIQAVLTPDDPSALKRVLAGPFIGVGAHRLKEGASLGIMQEARLFFQKERASIDRRGWCAFFETFLQSTWDRVSILEALLERKDTSLYFELRQLMQVFLQAPQETLFSLEGFLSFFKNLAHLDAEDDLLKVASETEEDLSVIMTIHASKGLEFDVVFALGLISRSSSLNEIISVRKDKKEILQKWDENDASCIASLLETDAEKMRHLYVALTRAKKKLYIPYAFDLDQTPLDLSQAAPIELLAQSFGQESFDLLSAYPRIPSYTKEKLISHLEALSQKASIGYTCLKDHEDFLEEKIQLKPLNALSDHDIVDVEFTMRRTLSFSSIQEKGSLLKMPSLLQDSLEEGVLPLGAETGILLHAIFEEVIKEGYHRPYDELSISQVIEEKIKATTLSPWQESILAMVKEVLHQRLISSFGSFSLTDVDKDNFFLEEEFAFESQGHMMKGFIDAIFFYKGRYYIIDWKSNYLAKDKKDYTREMMQQAMVQHRYDLQGAIYAEALRRYLSIFDRNMFDTSFGGAFYLFLRAAAAYHFMPDLSLIDTAPHTKEETEEVYA